MLTYKYLDRSALANLDRYKYSCVDTSPLANYVCHPFWNQVVCLFPSWIAPNLMTVVGFLACILHAVIPAVIDWNYNGNLLDIPSKAWLAMAALLFISHTLDGIDGKQARRIGMSSPVGELLDHGCDSYAVVFIVSSIYALFGRFNQPVVGISPIHIVATLGLSCLTFHICHWEKYNTGIMYLPWSYDLSMVTFTGVFCVIGLSDRHRLVELMIDFRDVTGISVAACLYLLMTLIVFGFTLPTSIFAVWQCRSKDVSKCPAGTSLVECLRPLISLVVGAIVVWLWLWWSPNRILDLDARLVFFTIGTVYTNVACRLIVSQMTAVQCESVNKLVIMLLVVSSTIVITHKIQPMWMTSNVELNIGRSFALLCLVVHLHYATNIVRQLCAHLQIPCFTVPHIRTKSKRT